MNRRPIFSQSIHSSQTSPVLSGPTPAQLYFRLLVQWPAPYDCWILSGEAFVSLSIATQTGGSGPQVLANQGAAVLAAVGAAGNAYYTVGSPVTVSYANTDSLPVPTTSGALAYASTSLVTTYGTPNSAQGIPVGRGAFAPQPGHALFLARGQCVKLWGQQLYSADLNSVVLAGFNFVFQYEQDDQS